MSTKTPGGDLFSGLIKAAAKPKKKYGELPIGTTVGGRFTVHKEIGEGGFARVYSATDPSRGTVALKVCPAPKGQADKARREYEVSLRLNHPNIVTATDAVEDQENGYLILAMPLIAGRDLREVAGQGRLTGTAAARIILQVAEALHYLHAQGFFHRDLKPENILVDASGRAVLLDFGATVTGDELWDAVGRPTQEYTTVSGVTGDSKGFDWTAEVYSLGAILFELVAGTPLAEYTPGSNDRVRNSIGAVAGFMAELQPPSMPEGTPEPLQDISDRALQRGRKDAFLTAGEMAGALRDFLVRAGEAPPPATIPAPSAPAMKRLRAWRLGGLLADAKRYGNACRKQLACKHANGVLTGTGVAHSVRAAYWFAKEMKLVVPPPPDSEPFQSVVYRFGRMTRDDIPAMTQRVRTLRAVIAEMTGAAKRSLRAAGKPYLAAFEARLNAGTAGPDVFATDPLAVSLPEAGVSEPLRDAFVAKLQQQEAEFARHLHRIDRGFEIQLLNEKSE